MTASKTANLGLMSPVGADPFVTADFADTMAILDLNPGIRTVANAASRPTGWTAAQHGRRVYQTDQQIEWVWHMPDGGTPGVWKRTYPKGLLASVANYSTISTTNTNYGAGPTLVEALNVVLPGGRPVRYSFRCEWLANSNNMSIISVHQDGSMISWLHFGGSTFDGGRGMPSAHEFSFSLAAPASQQTSSFKLTLSSHNGFGGNTICWGPSIEIVEY